MENVQSKDTGHRLSATAEFSIAGVRSGEKALRAGSQSTGVAPNIKVPPNQLKRFALHTVRSQPGCSAWRLEAAARLSGTRHALLRRHQLGSAPAAWPNPSFKPSPNGKPPGQRYSALSLLLQRWPGVSPLVPA
jgi:hypothetical protein